MELTVLKDLAYQDSFKGKVNQNGKQNPLTGTFKILSNNAVEKRMSIKTKDGVVMTITYDEIDNIENIEKKSEKKKPGKGKGDGPMALPPHYTIDIDDKFLSNDYESELLGLIKAGIKNIWLVGPAGCGKTTITRNVAKSLNVGIHVISCGLGTSASEFIGYKYPARENTPFAEYYAMPSIILLDEFTALDPAVAQISNSALANGFIMTTNGKIERHKDCIIVATSNTFGQGANRQYVANNQLDASTIDRFVGGILEMDYSETYEKQYDQEVYTFVKTVREVIKSNTLRRIASTRMLIEGCKLKEGKVHNWKMRLVSNWTKPELELLRDNKTQKNFTEVTTAKEDGYNTSHSF